MNDQNIIPLFIAGSLLLTMFGFFLIAYLLVQKRKQNKYQLEKQKMVFDHEKNILRAKIEEQEITMNQLASEIHDNQKSYLGYAQMHLQRIDALKVTEEQGLLLNKANEIIELVIEDLRNISHSLAGNFVKNIGLKETITKELENIRLSKNITCYLEVIGESFSLGPERDLHIYRIAQEAIQNSIKHGKGKNLNFTLHYEPEVFIMNIADDGIGFDKAKIHEMKGLGFLNMFQRARYVHGILEVQSALLQGSVVTLTLNLKKDGISD